jgi:hypothetical protein
VIGVMKSRGKSYSHSEIHGLELALEMLNQGNKLFDQLSKEDQKKLVYLITDIEKDMLDQVS